jgi:hypothetical protein
MQITKITHEPGKGSYAVDIRFGPSVAARVFGPATLGECERYILEKTIAAKEA